MARIDETASHWLRCECPTKDSFGNILSARAPVDDNDVGLTMPGSILRAGKTLIGQQSLVVVSDGLQSGRFRQPSTLSSITPISWIVPTAHKHRASSDTSRSSRSLHSHPPSTADSIYTTNLKG